MIINQTTWSKHEAKTGHQNTYWCIYNTNINKSKPTHNTYHQHHTQIDNRQQHDYIYI